MGADPEQSVYLSGIVRQGDREFKAAYDVLPAEMQDGGRADRVAAAAYLAKCYLTLAWGDGYEATTGTAHINTEYMKKVKEYTDVVKNSRFDYLEDFGDIFLRNIRTARNRCLPCRHLPMRMTIQDSGVATGRTLLTVAGRYGHADGTATNRRRTLSARSRQRTVSRCSMIMTTTIRIRRLEWLRLRNGIPRLFHTVGMPSFPYKYEAEYTLTIANTRAE